MHEEEDNGLVKGDEDDAAHNTNEHGQLYGLVEGLFDPGHLARTHILPHNGREGVAHTRGRLHHQGGDAVHQAVGGQHRRSVGSDKGVEGGKAQSFP